MKKSPQNVNYNSLMIFSPFCHELPTSEIGLWHLLLYLHLLCGLYHIFTSCSLFRIYSTTVVFQPSKSINVTPWVYTSFFIIQL